MKHKIWPSLLFALIGGAVALWVALQSTPTRQTGQAWESFQFEDIKAIAFETPKFKVRFAPLSINYGWIEYTESGKPTHTFLAGPKGKELWFNLSPMWASKVLGNPASLDLKLFGLDTADKRFIVELDGGKDLSYRIGGRGFQSSDHFVLDAERDAVFLWDRQTVNLLENAEGRLSVDTLGFLDPELATKITLIHADSKRTLVRSGKEWQEDAKPVAKSEPFLLWLKKVSELKAGGYRSADAAKSTSEPLFALAMEGSNAWNVSVSFDAETHAYALRFAEDKPSMLIDEKIFKPLYEELRLGTLPPKI